MGFWKAGIIGAIAYLAVVGGLIGGMFWAAAHVGMWAAVAVAMSIPLGVLGFLAGVHFLGRHPWGIRK